MHLAEINPCCFVVVAVVECGESQARPVVQWTLTWDRSAWRLETEWVVHVRYAHALLSNGINRKVHDVFDIVEAQLLSPTADTPFGPKFTT